MKKILAVTVFLVALAIFTLHAAQNPALTPSTLTIPATVLHTNCAATAGQTTYCFAGDGLWISLNGAAWVQVQTGTAVAGVTSWNGLTGAVTYAGVNSVQQCNLAGANCSTVQTGNVVLKIPQSLQ